MNSRLMPLEGAVNVRDVGGYRSVSAPQIASGRVLRADALSRLTEADVGRLGAFGLRTVVDFRLPGEVLVNGEDRLPSGVTRVSLPVNGGDLGTFYDLIASGDHHPFGYRFPFRRRGLSRFSRHQVMNTNTTASRI